MSVARADPGAADLLRRVACIWRYREKGDDAFPEGTLVYEVYELPVARPQLRRRGAHLPGLSHVEPSTLRRCSREIRAITGVRNVPSCPAPGDPR